MSRRAFMREHTDREFRTIVEWMALEDNRPTRSDWYLMQIALQVARKFATNPAGIQLKDFVLSKELPVKLSEQEQVAATQHATAVSKFAWGARLYGSQWPKKLGNQITEVRTNG